MTVIPDKVTSPELTLDIVNVINSNVLKKYQTIVSNLKLEDSKGMVRMDVFDGSGKIIESQGPREFNLPALGSREEINGSVFQFWEFPLGDKFDPGLQHFVVFTAWKNGKKDLFARAGTNFLIEDTTEVIPGPEKLFS